MAGIVAARAWRLDPAARSIDGLAMAEVEVPPPAPGEIRVRVRACSLNYRDKLVVEGMYPAGEPFVPLSDGAGEVVDVGAGVTRFRPGDRVAGCFFERWLDGPPIANSGQGLGRPGAPGMLADYVTLPEQQLVHVADSLDYEAAATLPCAGVTAWNALMEGPRPVIPGDWVLVLGTGGVALIGLQIARAAGARVIVTSSSDAKLARAIALGAEAGINYRADPRWGEQAARLSGGGVAHVVETVGAATLAQSMAAVRHGGEIALIGVLSREGDTDPGLLRARQATMRGIAVGSRAMAEKLNRAIDATRFAPPIDSLFGFEEARDAYRRQASPELFGKIVIRVA